MRIDFGNVPASVAAAVASIVAARAWWSERRAKDSAVSARVDAARAVAAAEESAQAAGRVAAALERQTELVEAAAAQYRIPWELAWVRGDTYALRNLSDSMEYKVNIDGDRLTHTGGVSWDTVDARSERQFMAISAAQFSPRVVVTWRRHSSTGETQTWDTTLPAKG